MSYALGELTSREALREELIACVELFCTEPTVTSNIVLHQCVCADLVAVMCVNVGLPCSLTAPLCPVVHCSVCACQHTDICFVEEQYACYSALMGIS